jgi:tripartite-type tricarboxylate transporter receptor subunit TctC
MLPRALALTFAVAALGASPAMAADTVADFYKGKTVTILVGSEAGGVYDNYSRLLARFLPKHIPGNPNVIVQQMLGAGSLTAANHVTNIGPQDGTLIASVTGNLPFAPLLDDKAARFDVLHANWLPNPATDTATVTVWHTAPVNSFLEARNKELVMGASSPNSSPAFYARIFVDVFKVKFKIVTGYASSGALFLAMEKGEADGHPSATLTSIKSSYASLYRDGKLKILLQFGEKPNPELKGVPFARDLADNDDDKLLLDMSMGATIVGRPFLMGPGVPADRVAAMRKAIMESYEDPNLRAEAAKLKLEIEPMSGEEVQQVITHIYSAPRPLIDRLQRINNAGLN